MLFDISSMHECAPGEPYVVEVYAVLQDTFDALDKQSTRATIDALAQRLRDALNRCPDIEVELVHVVGRREINVLQRERLRSLEIVWPQFRADTRGV